MLHDIVLKKKKCVSISNIHFLCLAEPEDIANGTIFLLCDYSTMSNGLNLYVDEGFMTEWVTGSQHTDSYKYNIIRAQITK